MNSGYAVKCTELGIKIEDTCTASDTDLEVLNDPVTGDAETPGGATAEPLANCSIGGNGKGVNETDELATTTLINGELLTVSREGSPKETLSAEWLADGNKIATALESQTIGAILLEDSGVPASALCNGILLGTVGPGDADEITEVLNLAKEKVALGGLALSSAKGDCSNESGCVTPIEVFPEGLPWTTKLSATGAGNILDLITNSGYTVKCTELGIKIEDTCTVSDTELEVLNDPVTGDAEIPAEALAEPFANCTIGGNGKGVNETDELATTTLINGELLTVSPE